MNIERMTCGEAHERLLLYVGGDLEQDVLDAVAAHLESCGTCAREAENARSARRDLLGALRERGNANGGPSDPGLWPGIRAVLVSEGLIHEPAERPGVTPVVPLRSRRARWTLALAPLAAAAALLLVTQLSGTFRSASPGHARPAPELLGRPSPEGVTDVVFAPEPVPAPPSTGTLRRLAPDEVQPLRAFTPRGAAPTAEGGISLAGFERAK